MPLVSRHQSADLARYKQLLLAMGCTNSVAEVVLSPAERRRSRKASQVQAKSDEASKEQAPIDAASKQGEETTTEPPEADTFLEVDDVQLFTLHDEQTPSNDFSWNCQEYEGETVEYNLGGNTVAPPEASSPNSDSWLGTAFWPHQNCSPDEVTEDGTIFSLSTEGPVQESLICLPPHGATSLRNGTLQLPPHAAIVLNSSIKFHNVKIKGGIVVCYGSCSASFTDCTLDCCTLVVMEGASVALMDTRIYLKSPNDEENTEYAGVAMFVTGSGTTVHMSGGRVVGGLQGITIQNGAHLISAVYGNPEFPGMMHRPTVEGFGRTGIDVSDSGSTLELCFSDVTTQSKVDSYGVHVHSNSKAVLSSVLTDGSKTGLKISSTEPVTLNRCQLAGTATGVHVRDGASATLTECLVRDWGHGSLPLLVEGEGTHTDVVGCIIDFLIVGEHEVEAGETSKHVSVVAKGNGAIETKRCYIKGEVVSESSGTISILAPVEEVGDNPSNPAYLGNSGEEQVDKWDALDPPSKKPS